MSKKIILRNLQRQDYEPLEKIISETWGFERFCSPKVATRLSRAYLCSCLTEQTFIKVAAINEQAVGIIMGRNARKRYIPFKYRLRSLWAGITLLSSPEGRTVINLFGDMDMIDDELLKKTHRNYEGELSFFIVDKSYRGIGLGQRLFDSFMEYMRAEKIASFYLYTDTDCNFGFYEQQGLTRREEIKHTFRFNEETLNMSFFLYDYERKQEIV